jgi:hypothetical protein
MGRRAVITLDAPSSRPHRKEVRTMNTLSHAPASVEPADAIRLRAAERERLRAADRAEFNRIVGGHVARMDALGRPSRIVREGGRFILATPYVGSGPDEFDADRVEAMHADHLETLAADERDRRIAVCGMDADDLSDLEVDDLDDDAPCDLPDDWTPSPASTPCPPDAPTERESAERWEAVAPRPARRRPNLARFS